jgi:hypothetical protein
MTMRSTQFRRAMHSRTRLQLRQTLRLKPAARQTTSSARKDKARIHVTRCGILSRVPLQALARLGENVRQLRRLEAKWRAELRPSGVIGSTLFDRLWSSYLRCLLASHAEAMAIAPEEQQTETATTPTLMRKELPTLVWTDQLPAKEKLSSELFRHLALVQRYDAHFSREMYRSLGMLLVLRDNGEAVLARCITKTLGINHDHDHSEG